MTTPSPARMYDWLLGGSNNLPCDRRAAQDLERTRPGAAASARANRAFMRQTVRQAIDRRITQFLDLGSGLPTVGHIHHTAREHHPAARVVYTDIDPDTVAQGQALLAGVSATAMIQADLRDPAAVLTDPAIASLIDINRPLLLTLISVLHLIPDSDDPARIVGGYRDRLAPGSLLALTHLSGQSPATPTYPPLHDRTAAQIRSMLTGIQIHSPGLVPLHQWPGLSKLSPVPVLAAIGDI